MTTIPQYEALHRRVVTDGIVRASTIHSWNFRQPKRRPFWQSALMGLCLSFCALVLAAETGLWLVSR